MHIASINVNGIRAAFRKGMAEWLKEHEPDIVALQEVRASDDDLFPLFEGWNIISSVCNQKGRAGVAIATKLPILSSSIEFGADDFDTSGRWVEGSFQTPTGILRMASVYVHAGEVDTPKQVEKYRFLEAMTERLELERASGQEFLIVGDLNVGHRELDIKNWKGNLKNSGFLPQERAYFDRFFTGRGESAVAASGEEITGIGFVDIGRRWAGEVPGPYTWWSQRGQAFDTDTGWRIDYHAATPALADKVQDYKIHRAADYASRWSDHAPVVVNYAL